MNQENIAALLRYTYNPEARLREKAEKELKSYRGREGYEATLLQVIMNQRVEKSVRLAASILLKNTVHWYWTVLEPTQQENMISAKDRELIKKNLLTAIILQTDRSMRLQLLEVLFKIVRFDFPKSYPNLIQEIVNHIMSKDLPRMYGALSALKMIYKRYEYRSRKKTDDLERIVNATFPMLTGILKSILTMKQATQESYEMLRLVIKCFRMCTYLGIPKYFQNAQNLTPWIQALVAVVETPLMIDQKNPPRNQSDLKAMPQAKCKKWSLYTLEVVYRRFGTEKSITSGKDAKNFARQFDEAYSKHIARCVIHTLRLKSQNGPVTDRMVYTCFEYLSGAINSGRMYQLLRDQMKFLISRAIPATLSLTTEDLRMWKEDPQEYIRKDSDVQEESHDPRQSALSFLQDVVRVRTKDNLPLSLQTISHFCEQYAESKEDFRPKECGMHMLQSLSRLLLSDEKYYHPVEKMIINYVIPEFRSNHDILRARACRVIGNFAMIQFQDQEAFKHSLQSVCKCLTATSLPLKLAASKAMSSVVRNEDVVENIAPYLKEVLQEYFKLMDHVTSEEVVITLETLIARVGDEVAPFAVDIAKKMSEMFIHICQTGDFDDDDSAFTAVQIVRVFNTLTHVLAPLSKKPSGVKVYLALQETFSTVINAVLVPDGVEFYEDILDLIGALAKFSPQVSPYLWHLIPKVVTTFKEFGFDSVRHVFTCLARYIVFKTETVKRSPSIIKPVIELVNWIFFPSNDSKESNPYMRETRLLVQAQYMAKMLSVCILHLGREFHGMIEHVMKSVFQKLQSLSKLQHALTSHKAFLEDEYVSTYQMQAKALRTILVETLATTMYCAPEVFLGVCAKLNCTKDVFSLWMSSIESTKANYNCLYTTVLGLSTLSALPKASLPPQLVGPPLIHLLNANVDCAETLRQIEEKHSEDGTDDEDVEFEDEKLVEFENVEDTQDAKDDGENVDEMAQRIRHALNQHLEGALNDGNLVEFFDPVLSDVDPVVTFIRGIEKLSSRNPDIFQAWRAQLPPAAMKAAEVLVNEGKERIKKSSQESS